MINALAGQLVTRGASREKNRKDHALRIDLIMAQRGLVLYVCRCHSFIIFIRIREALLQRINWELLAPLMLMNSNSPSNQQGGLNDKRERQAQLCSAQPVYLLVR